MEKDYDEDYYRLQDDKQSNESKQRECQKEIDNIGDKIDRLRDAYNAIDEEKEAINQIKIMNKNIPDSYEEWTGKNAEIFFDMCESGELKSSYEGYISNIDRIQDDINWEIYHLEAQQNEQYGILSGLVDAWDKLCTKIENYVN